MSGQQQVSTQNHLINFTLKRLKSNKATIDEVVRFSHFMRKSDAEVVEAIDIYKAIGDDIPYGPEDQSTEPPQQD